MLHTPIRRCSLPRPSAYSTYLAYEGLNSFFFWTIVTSNLVYQVSTIGLNPLQLVLVGTLLEATCFLGEIPTGVVADVYSRRLSVVIGTFLTGAGFVLEGAIPHLWNVLLAQVIWGLGATFTSGALEAWIADEVGEPNAGRAYLRGAQVGQLGALAGTGVSVALASIRLNLPILVGGALMMVLSGYLAAAMREHGFRPAPRMGRVPWRSMLDTFRGGLCAVRLRPALATILAIGAIFGMFSEGFDRLWTPHLLMTFTLPPLGPFKPVVWFGVIYAASMLLTAGATEIARRRLDTNSHRGVARALSAINLALIGCVLVLGLAGGFALALVALLATQPLRRITSPLQTAWVNQRLESGVRATVISMSAQVDAFGQIVGGPILGAVATLVSLRASMVVTALVLVPAVALYARTMGSNAHVQTPGPQSEG